MDENAMREAVARTAHALAGSGLTGAFGHVSARVVDGFVITSTAPLSTQGPDDAVAVTDASAPLPDRAPLETPMHAAIYRARPDIAAICRGHPAAVVAWGTGSKDLPLLHGLGAIAGERVAVHPDVDLITTPAQGEAVAATLGTDWTVILRANGCLAAGGTLLEALTRLYFLEERASVVLAAPHPREEIDWGGRLRHSAAELVRAMAWVEATFGDPSTHTTTGPSRSVQGGANRLGEDETNESAGWGQQQRDGSPD